MDSEDPDFTTSLTKHLQDVQAADLFRRRSSAPDLPGRRPGKVPISSGSEEEGGLTGRSRLSIPEFPMTPNKTSKTKLPSFLRKPELRPTSPHVGVGYDRFCAKGAKDKFGRVADSIGALTDIWDSSTGETKLSRLGELTVFALRGCGAFTTRFGTGVYGPELESTWERQSLSSRPSIWSPGIKCPMTYMIARWYRIFHRVVPILVILKKHVYA